MRQGNVFTPVYDLVYGGGALSKGSQGETETLSTETPWTQTPQTVTLPWTETPTQDRDHPGQRPPPTEIPLPRHTVTSGRYVSYWNAFLSEFVCQVHLIKPNE